MDTVRGTARAQAVEADAAAALTTDASTDDPAGMPSERLEAEICELAAHIAAAECRWLLMIAEFDERRVWADWGCLSAVDWLTWRCAMSRATAHEKLRVARALRQLPDTRARFANGQLSYSQVRAISRVGTDENEADLLMIAENTTAAELDRIVRGWRRATREDDDNAIAFEQFSSRYAIRHTTAFGMRHVEAELAPEDGALFDTAIDIVADQLRGRYRAAGAGDSDQADDGLVEPTREQLRADAYVAVARAIVAGGGLPDHDRNGETGNEYVTLVHTEATTLTANLESEAGADAAARDLESPAGDDADDRESAGTESPAGDSEADGGDPDIVVAQSPAGDLQPRADTEDARAPESSTAESPAGDSGEHPLTFAAVDTQSGRCHLDNGPALAPETVRRLCCEGAAIAIIENKRGEPLDVGRKTRTPNRKQRRALYARDNKCRWPGCPNTRYLDAHHLVPWLAGGRTDLDNLALFCPAHHRLIHEGGWTVSGNANGALTIFRPDGSPLPTLSRPPSHPNQLAADNTHDHDLDIHSTTIVPEWDGTKADLGYVLDTLITRDIWRKHNTRPPAPSAI